MRPPPIFDTFGFVTSDLTGTWAFFRYETRHSTSTRSLDCGHRISPSESYEYSVGKMYGEAALLQRRDCDVCMRRGHRY